DAPDGSSAGQAVIASTPRTWPGGRHRSRAAADAGRPTAAPHDGNVVKVPDASASAVMNPDRIAS
ncbi:MAG TPA: hypothetical protein VIK31_01680, partial [Propionibacteriaceae bacterium]